MKPTSQNDPEPSLEGGQVKDKQPPGQDVEPPKKKSKTDASRRDVRVRKRSKYVQVVEQMEFYFSDANVGKSSFMQERIAADPEGWVELSVFNKFNKLVAILKQQFGIGTDLEEEKLHKELVETKLQECLWKSLSRAPSDMLEVKEDESGIRWVHRKVPIVKYSEEEVEARTVYVENIPSSVDAEALKELFTQYGPVAYVSLPKYRNSKVPKGFGFIEFRSAQDADKALESYGISRESAEAHRHTKDPAELQSIKAHNQEECLETSSAAVPGSGDKKKRKRKKKKVIQSKDDPDATELELRSLSLNIMPKQTWRRLRNQYLNEQRSNMATSKKRLKLWENDQGMRKKESPALPAAVKKETKEIAFVHGTVIRFSLDAPIEDKPSLKKKVKAALLDGIQYVDACEGDTEYFVRCAEASQATSLSKVKCLGESAEVLTGQAEQDYWERLNLHRHQKLNKDVKVPSKKPRGKDRLLVRVEGMQNNHSYFTQDE